jgi:hypothetical protein
VFKRAQAVGQVRGNQDFGGGCACHGTVDLIKPDTVVLLDRHYISFQPYREDEASLYAARVGSQLMVRYAQFQGERVVLRAHQAKVNAEVLQAEPGRSAHDLLVGRVALRINRD